MRCTDGMRCCCCSLTLCPPFRRHHHRTAHDYDVTQHLVEAIRSNPRGLLSSLAVNGNGISHEGVAMLVALVQKQVKPPPPPTPLSTLWGFNLQPFTLSLQPFNPSASNPSAPEPFTPHPPHQQQVKAAPPDSEADARQRAETGGGVLQYLQLGESALLPAAELCGWKGGGGYGVGTAGGGGQQRISLANMKLCMEVRGIDMQLCWEVRARVRLCTMRSSPCAIHLPTHVVCTHQHGPTAPRLSRFTVAVPAEQLYRCWPQCGMYTRGLPRTDTHAAQCNATCFLPD
jgi:hypothetical protein